MTFRATISAAQLQALDAEPVQLIARPEADSYIHLLRVDMALMAGNTPYVSPNDVMLVYGADFTNGLILWPGSFLEGTVDALALGQQNGTADEPNFITQPLVLTSDGAAPTLGNGTVTLYGSFIVFKV